LSQCPYSIRLEHYKYSAFKCAVFVIAILALPAILSSALSTRKSSLFCPPCLPSKWLIIGFGRKGRFSATSFHFCIELYQTDIA